MSASRPPSRFPPGSRLGPFVVVSELGEGGMGIVLHARDPQGRDVALKLLTGQSLSPQSIERFQRESQLTASLRHPAIVTVHEAGLVAGRPYIAYALVPGGATLEDVLAQGHRDRALELIAQTAEALGFAHAQGVNHRDVKPSNVLVTPDDRAQLADFGLAQAVGLERLTRTGALVGTPECMAPEQVAGKRDAFGPQTDVWALGVLLYRALTGQRPFMGVSLTELAARIAGQEPTPPRRVAPTTSRTLDAVCLRALRKQPEARYPDAAAFAADLRAAIAGRSTQARPPSRAPWVGAGVLIAGLTLGGVAVLRDPPSPAPSPSPSDPPSPSDARALARERRLVERLTHALAALERDPTGGGVALGRLDPDALAASSTCQDRLLDAQRAWAKRAADAAQSPPDPEALLPSLRALAQLAQALPADAPPFPGSTATTDQVVRFLSSTAAMELKTLPFMEALATAGGRVGDQSRAQASMRLTQLGVSQSEWRITLDEARRFQLVFARLDVGFRNGLSLQGLASIRDFEPRGDDVWSRYTRARIRAQSGTRGRDDRARLAELLDDPTLRLGPVHRAETITLAALDVDDIERRLAAFDAALQLDPDCVPTHYHRARTLLEAGRFAEGLAAQQRAREGFTTQGLPADPYSARHQLPDLTLLGVALLAGLDRRDEARAALVQWREELGSPQGLPKELVERHPWLATE